MRALSAQTSQSDPYRAGLELGEALAECAPEVVFLFSSIHYGLDADLAEGVSDALIDSIFAPLPAQDEWTPL